MNACHTLNSTKLAIIAAGSAMASFALPASAVDPSSGSLSVRAGAGDHYQRLELAWESPSIWRYQFSGNNSRLDLVAELGVAYWNADGSRSPSNAWQLSVIPFLRWTINERYYVEAGIGPSVFSRTHFAGKEISTAFQFGDHIGVGAYLSEASRIGLRYSHFSNAGIERPNPGVNILQLTYSYRY